MIFLVFAVFVSKYSLGKSGFNSPGNTSVSVSDSTGPKSLINKEFKYIAPKSSMVYIVWSIDQYSMEEAISWNENTRINFGSLTTPMDLDKDTFFVSLKVPSGVNLTYNFWITKTRKGHYVDFWDPSSSGTITVTDEDTVINTADYSIKQEEKIAGMMDKGWVLLLIFVVILAFLVLIEKKWLKLNHSVSIYGIIFFWGISLALFHLLARADIIAVNPLRIPADHSIPMKILKAGRLDLLYVFMLVAFFEFVLWLVKSLKGKKIVMGIYIGISIISALAAFSNVTTVKYLGKPFNYQWLYYSDFLGSDEAMNAMKENLSLVSVISLISLCISVWILSQILIYFHWLLKTKKYLAPVVYSICILLIGIIAFKSRTTKETWTKGQSDNPVTEMISSIITLKSNSSFYLADVPKEMLPFNPSQETLIQSPVEITDNSKVKNVLFIVLESAGAVYCDAYGGNYGITPNLNKYESQALRFENAYAHAPATNRSLVSILGSIYPYLSYKSLTQEFPAIYHPTISSILKSKGYRTSFFSSANLNFQNCREFLSYRDFDRVEDFSSIDCGEKFQLDSENYKEGNGIDDMCLADMLTSWIDEDTTKNFFSLIWTVQCHYPYFFDGNEKDFKVPDFYLNRYLNALKHDDELIGEVMVMLEDRGLASSTLVVVVGDHGEAFGQHGQYGHGTELFEENVKVPLYFINSTLFHGEIKNDIAGLKDLGTTSLSILGVDVPEIWQGRNLLKTSSDEAFYYSPWSDYLFSYRKGNMKFIFNETRNTTQVFNLSTDKNERTNLADQLDKDEILYARNSIAAWVQNQDKFIKKLNGAEQE